MRKVRIFDTTLRDGEQSPGCSMDIVAKVTIARSLAKLGVDVIEAGFPVSSPGDFEAVSKIARDVKGVTICALARTRKEDIEAAAKALKDATSSRIHVFVATSDVHMSDKLRKSPEEILEMIAVHVKLAKTFTNDVQFSPEDATRTGLDFLLKAVTVAVQAGATTINIPDTVGYSMPGEFGRIVGKVLCLVEELSKDVVVSVHCHNDLGLAVANSLAGVHAGAKQVECCVTGIGERAGNAQLEAVVMALKTRRDYFDVDTRIVTQHLGETARLVSAMIGKPICDTMPVVGPSAFRHSSGIHQHGMSKNRTTYEIMNPEDVGWQGDSSPLTSRSGRTALRTRLIALGYAVDEEAVESIYQKFVSLADSKKFVYSDDLHLLMQEFHVEAMAQSEKLLRVVRVDYHRVENALSATVTLGQNGLLYEASGSGDGPVSCIGAAILKVLERMKYPVGSLDVRDFNNSKSAGGIEAIGLANIKIEDGKGVGYGRGSDTDIMVAVAKAMVSAINHLMQTPVQESNSNGD